MGILGIRRPAKRVAAAIDNGVAAANNAIIQQLGVANNQIALVAGDVRLLLAHINDILPENATAQNLWSQISNFADNANIGIEKFNEQFFDLLAVAIQSIKTADCGLAKCLSNFEIMIGNADRQFSLLGGDAHCVLAALQDLLENTDKYMGDLFKEVHRAIKIAEIKIHRTGGKINYVLDASKDFIDHSSHLVDKLFQNTNREMAIVCHCINKGVTEAVITMNRVGKKTESTLDAAKNFIDDSGQLVKQLCKSTHDELTVLLRDAGEVSFEAKIMIQNLNRKTGYVLEAGENFINQSSSLLKQLCDDTTDELKIFLRDVNRNITATALMAKQLGHQSGYVLKASESFIQHCDQCITQLSTTMNLQIMRIGEKAEKVLIRADQVLDASHQTIQTVNRSATELHPLLVSNMIQVNRLLVQSQSSVKNFDNTIQGLGGDMRNNSQQFDGLLQKFIELIETLSWAVKAGFGITLGVGGIVLVYGMQHYFSSKEYSKSTALNNEDSHSTGVMILFLALALFYGLMQLPSPEAAVDALDAQPEPPEQEHENADSNEAHKDVFGNVIRSPWRTSAPASISDALDTQLAPPGQEHENTDNNEGPKDVFGNVIRSTWRASASNTVREPHSSRPGKLGRNPNLFFSGAKPSTVQAAPVLIPQIQGLIQQAPSPQPNKPS